MEVLEAIQRRRTVRVPFNGASVRDDLINTLLDVSDISPSGDPVSWRLVRVDDEKKPELARIVKEDFGDHFQKDGRRFKQVFSQYPRWLRFSEASDGIRLAGLPKIAGYFFRVALGARFGPLFGKLGIMNAEIKSYCRNVVANPALFGVFLDRRVSSTTIAPIVNAGSMLQNMRLAATSLGLCYQDLGWITATRTASEKARVLLGLSDNYGAINFFRIGHADDSGRQDKKSDFRRDLQAIVHVEKFGRRDYQDHPAGKTNIPVLAAIGGSSATRDPRPVSGEELFYVLEAARWAPTGFNVQPFEFLVDDGEDGRSIVILEDRDRRDPDPGPCEALARGGLVQNIRLAARAVGLPISIKMAAASDKDTLRRTHVIPENFSIIAQVHIGRGDTCRP